MTTDGGATIGSTVITVWGPSADASSTTPSGGFAGPGWTSVSIAPSSGFTSATILAGDTERLLVGRWVAPGKTAMDSPTVKIQVLDVTSGKVLSQPACEPTGGVASSSSPDGKHEVLGPIRIDSSGGNATCFGGGAGEKTVVLTAVTDDGRAFGTAGAGGSTSSFVTVASDGQITTEPFATGVTSPIGIMSGGIAVFWDPTRAILTGNPIR